MTQRINYMQQSPDLTKKLFEVAQLLAKCSIEQPIIDLVSLRASQMNGCTFCIDMHVKEAKIHGEHELRLHHVAGWRESTLFAARERAALAWTEALTHLSKDGVPDEVYERVRTQLSEKELSDLTFVIMSINGWNRANIAFKMVPGSYDKAFGLDKAGMN